MATSIELNKRDARFNGLPKAYRPAVYGWFTTGGVFVEPVSTGFAGSCRMQWLKPFLVSTLKRADANAALAVPALKDWPMHPAGSPMNRAVVSYGRAWKNR